MPATPLPKTSVPAERALNDAGVHPLEDLARHTEAELAALHGVGPKALRILREAMAAHGVCYR